MLTLSNGATVLAAFIQPAQSGMKPLGVVLAETATAFVTWEIHSDGAFDLTEESADEVWEAESGHYFNFSQPADLETGVRTDPRALAEFDFGLRLKRTVLTDAMLRAVKDHG